MRRCLTIASFDGCCSCIPAALPHHKGKKSNLQRGKKRVCGTVSFYRFSAVHAILSTSLLTIGAGVLGKLGQPASTCRCYRQHMTALAPQTLLGACTITIQHMQHNDCFDGDVAGGTC